MKFDVTFTYHSLFNIQYSIKCLAETWKGSSTNKNNNIPGGIARNNLRSYIGRYGLYRIHINDGDFSYPFFLFFLFPARPVKNKPFVSYARVWMNVFLSLVGCP